MLIREPWGFYIYFQVILSFSLSCARVVWKSVEEDWFWYPIGQGKSCCHMDLAGECEDIEKLLNMRNIIHEMCWFWNFRLVPSGASAKSLSVPVCTSRPICVQSKSKPLCRIVESLIWSTDINTKPTEWRWSLGGTFYLHRTMDVDDSQVAKRVKFNLVSHCLSIEVPKLGGLVCLCGMCVDVPPVSNTIVDHRYAFTCTEGVTQSCVGDLGVVHVHCTMQIECTSQGPSPFSWFSIYVRTSDETLHYPT